MTVETAADHVRAQPTQLDVFLQPGEWFVGDAMHRVRTLLGSCISVTLWSPRARLGAMSHSLLPTRARQPSGAQPDGRYGDEALALMLQGLAAAGVPPRHCEAKIFGGGDMFGTGHGRATTVGRRNGQAARELLREHGIAVVSESLFGEGHRQILFDIATGEVWARQIPPQPATLPVLPQAPVRKAA